MQGLEINDLGMNTYLPNVEIPNRKIKWGWRRSRSM